MLDSTHRHPFHPLTISVLAVLLALLGTGLWQAAPARADGDPASDVLATQPLFLASDAGFTPAAQAQLAAELAAAQRAHHPLRIAVIAGSADLGSVTALWRRPAAYARFLDQELSSVYPGPLLVLMPDGLGAAGPGADRALGAGNSGAPPAGAGPALQRVTLSAVARFLRAWGQPVPVGTPRVGTPAGTADPLVVVVLAIGAFLIAGSWALSLHTRPPGQRVT